ncbi:MAG: RDD family protein [Terriglobales bacterium]
MDHATGSDLAAEAQPRGDSGMAEPPGPLAAGTAGWEPDAEYWRREVAARLERYRSRRKPRAPKYPSLRLPFDAAESWSSSAGEVPAAALAAPLPTHQNVALQEEEPIQAALAVSVPAAEEQEPSAKIIQFPRSAAIPIFQASELAEPVLDRPRIVEAPEVVPPPPALGGILIEGLNNQEAEKRTGGDLPLLSASLARRLLAGLMDGLVLAAALAGLAAIFLQLNPGRGPIPLLAGGLVIAAALLWAAYEFLFVVYAGTTPGLRVARLRLAGFDGSPVPRRLRRWRVLASYLSALSLGLGYLWSMLDEDGLCWHDRITRTHIRPVTPPGS